MKAKKKITGTDLAAGYSFDMVLLPRGAKKSPTKDPISSTESFTPWLRNDCVPLMVWKLESR